MGMGRQVAIKNVNSNPMTMSNLDEMENGLDQYDISSQMKMMRDRIDWLSARVAPNNKRESKNNRWKRSVNLREVIVIIVQEWEFLSIY